MAGLIGVPMMVVLIFYELCIVISTILGAELHENSISNEYEDAMLCIFVSALLTAFVLLVDIVYETGKCGTPNKMVVYFISLVLFVAIILNIAGASLYVDQIEIACTTDACNELERKTKAHHFFIWVSPIFICATIFYGKLKQLGLVRC